jgi:hypothetical protein
VVTFPRVFIGSPENGNNEFVERTVFVSRREGAPATQPVTLRGRNISRLEQDFPGGSQVLGHLGGGLELYSKVVDEEIKKGASFQ